MQNIQQGRSTINLHKEAGTIYSSLYEKIMKEIQIPKEIPKFNQQLAESTV
ncbi:MAG: hypothetical protein IC227_01315 [Enterococcus lacertideformus]|uniref:Uncharacterized protein n=1 Tax=Enterococcus lacertideformus TaxID=2771493 RepID=A0A931AUY8_9ENTE|nr:hypothetical protein [Enterococcus lacertideformus]